MKITHIAMAAAMLAPMHAYNHGPAAGPGDVPIVATAALAAEAQEWRMPPESWAPADPADSLYKAARNALSDGDYRRAASLFRSIHDKYPDSDYAPDAYYWEAFALYRTDGTAELRQAADLLQTQASRFPDAKTRKSREAASLATRIRGRLAAMGDAQSAEGVAEAAKGAAGACPDEEDDDRVAALNALLQMDAESAMPILKKVLARRDPCSVTLRRKAVFLVSQKRTDETVDILVNAAKTDPDSEVREQAVFWLSQVPDERAVDVLIDILRTSNDTEVQDKAIFALSQHRSPKAAEMLRDYAQREGAPQELREKAIFWLGQRHSDENAQFLRDLFPKLKSDELKEKVLFSLSQMRNAGNEKWILDQAGNTGESIEVRKKALFWAGQGGAPIEGLIQLYSRMQDPEMREQLIFVYSQRRESTAVDKLLDIAKNEKDPELRKKAIFWLSQSRDPRVAQFLLDLIDK